MGKKKGSPLVPVSFRWPEDVFERFKHFCEHHVPRVTDTEIVVKAVTEYLNRHEEKPKKGEK